MTRLLLEIGCEELPARICVSCHDQLAGKGGADGIVAQLLREFRLVPASAAGTGAAPGAGGRAGAATRVLVSPRRIAVIVDGLPGLQLAETKRTRGPRTDVAFGPDGVATSAGAGFARGRGLDPSQLLREFVDGTEFVVAQVEAERRATGTVVPEIARRLINAIQVPRGMRWGARPAGEADYLRFSRPLRWLVCKLDHETVPFTFYGLESGDVSQGHRVLGSPVIIDEAAHYERHIREQMVIVSQDERRELIVGGLDALAKEFGGEWFDPGDVLDEAVYLVEWPSVHRGRFDERHLRLPDEALITAMQSHQRYFPVRDSQGALLPVFLYISNADPAAAATVTHGNERVLDGRLADAEFSYDRDLALGLEAMAAKLDAVVFHEKLGSLADKTARLQRLVGHLTPDAGEPATTALRAASLAKADLVSQMVQEFPTLQGCMGGYYAVAGDLGDAVSQAIAEHYLPLSAVAPVPATLAGAVLAVADKIDNIAGAWVAGQRPSGSRDPYGLRRAAMGIVRIALEFALRFPLAGLVDAALGAYSDQGRAVDSAARAEIMTFIWERLEGLLLDEGVPYALVEAALAADAADIPARAARARTFAALAGRDFFDDVVTVYNRCAALAAKAAPDASGLVDAALFSDPAEPGVHDALATARATVEQELAHLELTGALVAAAKLRLPVDRYFEAVLVMDADPRVRANRLAQLGAVAGLLRQIGDFGRLPVQQSE